MLEFILMTLLSTVVLAGVAVYLIWDSLDARDKWSVKDNIRTILEKRGVKL